MKIFFYDITGRAVSSCGNSIVDTGESCDDGNADDEDGCDSSCKVSRARSCITNPAPHSSGQVALHYSLGYPGLCTLLHENAVPDADRNKDGATDYLDSCLYQDYQNSCSADGTMLDYYKCSPANLPLKDSKPCPAGCKEGACA
ncbi:hypothetical protein HYU19_01360 [Candidatus Woesearchaeota archaeon]|nr:hypothetical protein [Candidatus Woesearchaeota archaeon]